MNSFKVNFVNIENIILSYLTSNRFLSFVCRFVFKLEEFNYCLAQIVSDNKPNMKISEWKYQCLFEKLLHLFSIYTW